MQAFYSPVQAGIVKSLPKNFPFGSSSSGPEPDPGSVWLIDEDGSTLIDDDSANLQEPT